jgi:hypothetical protein
MILVGISAFNRSSISEIRSAASMADDAPFIISLLSRQTTPVTCLPRFVVQSRLENCNIAFSTINATICSSKQSLLFETSH